MGFVYGKSTYSQIIADVTDDFVEQPAISQLSKALLKGWVNRAIQEISENCEIADEWPMRLVADQEDYPLRDRPAITDATNATPIVVSVAAHGFSEGDYINIRGVVGNLAANGSFRARNVATNTFELRTYKVISDASNESPINIKCNDHGFETGDSIIITEVEGNTAANGTFTITVVDDNNFTLDGSTGNAEYSSGGMAEKEVAGTGAYSRNGRVWSQSEIPTHFKKFKQIVRVYGDFKLNVDPMQLTGIHAMQDKHTRDGMGFDELTAPQTLTPVIIGDVRYMRLYPAPPSTEFATLYTTVRYNARYLNDMDDDDVVPLPYDWEPAIRVFLLSKIWGRLGDPTYPGRRRDSTSFESKYLEMFYAAINNYGRNMQATKKFRTTYT